MNNLAYEPETPTELLNGKTIAMSPRPAVNHNIVSGNIYRIFGNYLSGKPCIPFSDGVDVYLTDKDRVIPDGMIVCDPTIIHKNGIHGTPDLIVEVLSPTTAKHDKGYKKDLYEQCGVGEYWLVDTENKSIEVYLLNNGRYQLNDVYAIFPDFLVEKMTEEERNAMKSTFHPALFPTLEISLSAVFEKMIP